MWNPFAPKKPDTSAHDFARLLESVRQIALAEREGRAAWVLMAFNEARHENFLKPRQYRWTVADVERIVGAPVGIEEK